MTDLCTLLDAYLDGTLPENQAEHFEEHAVECSACESALALPAELAASLGTLADVECPPEVLASALATTATEWPETWTDELRGLAHASCPPAVLEAALRQTRRAPDRAPTQRSRSTVTRWAVGLAALLAVAVAWSARPDPTAALPEIADVETTEPVDSMSTRPGSLSADPVPPTLEEMPPLVAEADALLASPPPTRSPRPPAAPASPVDAPDPVDGPAPDLIADGDDPKASPPSQEIEDAPSAEAIEAAREDLALAFALIDRAQSRAGQRVREEAGALSSTIDHTLPF